MKNTFIAIVIISAMATVYAQEIKLSKENLYYQLYSSQDRITIYNIGTSKLVVDSIFKINYYGYNLNISSRDTSLNFLFTRPSLSFHITIEPMDSTLFTFGRPYCPICKSTFFGYDTLIIHSNAIIHPYSYLPVLVEGGVSVENVSTSIYEYKLYQNYPNPFNPTTSIHFSLARKGLVILLIYNTLGQQIYSQSLGRLEAGEHTVTWNALHYPAGTYYYKIESNDFIETMKMILLK